MKQPGLSARRLVILPAVIVFLAAPASRADILDDLKARQAGIRSVSAAFVQEKKTRLLAKPIRASGRFLYQQPGSIRWEYTGSTNMQVIFNGKDLWIYYPDLKEADKLSGVGQYGSMMHFDIATMSRDYAITAAKEKGLVRLSMTPKSKGPISLIEMDLQEGAAFPRMVRLLDRNSEPTTITFSNIKLNQGIPDSSFTFLPGKDVVIRDRSIP